jgi:hypothetical protein
MSEKCACKHFATREKYQDAAVLSTESDEARAFKQDCYCWRRSCVSRNILSDITVARLAELFDPQTLSGQSRRPSGCRARLRRLGCGMSEPSRRLQSADCIA